MKSYTWRAAILKSGLPPTTRHVLLTLSCHINDAGESAYPSVELLATETGLSKRAIITHLAIAKQTGWIFITKHGFAGKKWKRNEYYPRLPEENKGGAAGSPPQEEGGAGGSPQFAEGGEPNDNKVVQEVHLNYPLELPIKERGGCGHTETVRLPPDGTIVVQDEKIEQEVQRFKGMHLKVCGLATMPPLTMIREILLSGKPGGLIEDVYQLHGGDVMRWRQRNIVESLKNLRDGTTRQRRGMQVGPLSGQERRTQRSLENAEELLAGGPPC